MVTDIQRYAPGDLRAFLDIIESRGALKCVSGADSNVEIGSITEVNNHHPNPAALLFENIPGYATGRVLSSPTSCVATLAVALRLDADDTRSLVLQVGGGQMDRWFSAASNFPFEWVDDAPVTANVDTGAAIDVTKFPSPLWHSGDGGRYIGTGSVVITQDPETKKYNAGTYRCMVAGPDRIAIHMSGTSRHGMQHKLKYDARGERIPIVLSFGHDPLVALMSSLEIPEGVFECDVAAAIAGQPMRMLRGPVTGLPIPADAEIVVEGWLTEDMVPEGPFGEFTGYYGGGRRDKPTIKVEAVYYRDNPIILGQMPGKPPHDFSFSWSVLRSALIEDQIKGAGIPGVMGVWADEVGGARELITVSIKQRYFGHSRQAGLIASQCQAGAYYNRYVIVVDEDIDPSNLTDVMWAVVSRADPGSDIEILHKTWGAPGDPLRFTYPEGTLYNTRAVIDACRAFERIKDFAPVAASTPDEVRAINKKWAHLWT